MICAKWFLHLLRQRVCVIIMTCRLLILLCVCEVNHILRLGIWNIGHWSSRQVVWSYCFFLISIVWTVDVRGCCLVHYAPLQCLHASNEKLTLIEKSVGLRRAVLCTAWQLARLFLLDWNSIYVNWCWCSSHTQVRHMLLFWGGNWRKEGAINIIDQGPHWTLVWLTRWPPWPIDKWSTWFTAITYGWSTATRRVYRMSWWRLVLWIRQDRWQQNPLLLGIFRNFW